MTADTLLGPRVEALKQSAERAAASGEWEEAARLYREGLGIADSDDAFHGGLTNALLHLGDLESALAVLKESIAHNPRNAAWLSDLLVAHRPIHAAAEEYAEALQSKPRMLEADQYFATTLMVAKEFETALRYLPHVYGPYCKSIGIEAAPGEDVGEGTLYVEISDGAFRIVFPQSFSLHRMHCSRLLAYTDYLGRLAASGSCAGRVRLCLGDLPERDLPLLAMSAILPQHALIPDSSFLFSRAYESFREGARHSGIAWSDRTPKAYWRGSLTGLAGNLPDILRLPRVELCLAARYSSGLVDAKISRGGLGQFTPYFPELEGVLDALGILGDWESEAQNFRYRYLCDVDGNSNAWTAYYIKLLTGSAVIKLESTFRQWFYDRARPHEHYIPIKSIAGDLSGAITWLRQNDEAAQRIGAAGQALTSSMTVDSEFAFFKSAAERLMAEHPL